jgi:hypothetical protein
MEGGGFELEHGLRFFQKSVFDQQPAIRGKIKSLANDRIAFGIYEHADI